MSNEPIEIVDIPHERLDEATEVLARAFEDYPLMCFIFADSGDDYGRCLRDVMRFTCHARLVRGNSLKGVEKAGRLVAVACIDHPEEKPWPDALEEAYNTMLEGLGEQAAERMGRFGEIVGGHHPQGPHFYVVALGVLPDAQGQSYGRALLNLVHRMSEEHALSTGVGLDTETATNVPLYQHCGYEITGEDALDVVSIWFMFRPNGVEKANCPAL